jgi:hypothetical protein
LTLAVTHSISASSLLKMQLDRRRIFSCLLDIQGIALRWPKLGSVACRCPGNITEDTSCKLRPPVTKPLSTSVSTAKAAQTESRSPTSLMGMLLSTPQLHVRTRGPAPLHLLDPAQTESRSPTSLMGMLLSTPQLHVRTRGPAPLHLLHLHRAEDYARHTRTATSVLTKKVL